MLSPTRLSRTTEWWKPKAGVILSLLLFYLALWGVPFKVGVELLVFSIVTLIGFGLFGYFLNDWADIPFDEKAGKPNLVAGLSLPVRFVVLIGILCLTVFPWLVYFQLDRFSYSLITVQLLLQIAYPIPPIRLKRFPYLGMISDSAYAFVIPAILAWHTFDITANYSDNLGQFNHFVALGGWMFAMGLRHILSHHVHDKENDRLTGTPNITLELSPAGLRKLLEMVVFPIELFSAVAFFVTVSEYSGLMPQLFVVMVVAIGARLLLKHRIGFRIGFWKSPFDAFSAYYLGVVSCIILSLQSVNYLFFLFGFMLLFSNVISHPILLYLRGKVVHLIKLPFQKVLLIFNWSLYYFRKYVLRWSEKRNWGEHYQRYLGKLEANEKRSLGSVAVFNQNLNKYTETFVNGHLNQLPFYVYPFYGWPSPIQTKKQEWLSGNNLFLRNAKASLGQLFNRSANEVDNSLIASRLLEQNVSLILAEFGPMGARVTPIAQMTGAPLVVIFYGYDAWHSKALKENESGYQELFKYASAVLGVSQDLCKQLENIGCPKEKIQYLPCYIDLKRFAFVERNFDKKVILAVGRFCVTKAPHLTILAFSEVLKQHPNAELRMVGADEGNEILETCKSLVQSLGISERVTFLGSLSSDEVKNEMYQASIFTQHSVTAPKTGDKEGTPVAVMEAMATGLPVVATNHAGIAEMIESGVTGVLVDEFDYIEAANEVSKLLNNPIQMKEMGEQSARSIRENDLVVNHIDILTEIIKKHQVIV